MSLWETLDESAKEALQREYDEQGVSVEDALKTIEGLSTTLGDMLHTAAEAIRCVGEALADTFSQVSPIVYVQDLTELCTEGWDFVPPRVRHLAFHSPKARVRNKNWNRMWKIRERYMKCHKS